jgi:hypothetical protein
VRVVGLNSDGGVVCGNVVGRACVCVWGGGAGVGLCVCNRIQPCKRRLAHPFDSR